MLADLNWLGLDYDEGPEKGGEFGPYRQSERGAIYQTLARRLMKSGHVYKCFCTDEELEQMRAEVTAEIYGEVEDGVGGGSESDGGDRGAVHV